MTITISGETLEDIKTQIRAIESKQIGFVQGGPTNATTPGAFATQSPQATDAYVAEPNVPHCTHGPMKWREGTSKAGAHYAGHYCTAKEQSLQCRPIFPKKQIPADQKNVNYTDPL